MKISSTTTFAALAIAACLSFIAGPACAQSRTPRLLDIQLQAQVSDPAALRAQQRAHERLVREQMQLEPEYGSLSEARLVSTVLYAAAVLSGVTCVGALVVDLFRGVELWGPDRPVSTQDRILDLSIAGVAGAAFVVSLVLANNIRNERSARYDMLRERVERRLALSAVTPYATPTSAGVMVTCEFDN